MIFVKKHLQQFALAGVILLFCALFCATSPYFWDADNLRNILDQSTVNVVAGLGMTLVLTSGVTDLSVGSAAALTGVLTALAMKAGAPAWAGCVLALLCGLGVGLWNSLIIVRVGVNPFMGTLTSMSIFSGLALVITQASPVYGLPPDFTWIGRGHVGGVAFGGAVAADAEPLVTVGILTVVPVPGHILAFGRFQRHRRQQPVEIFLRARPQTGHAEALQQAARQQFGGNGRFGAHDEFDATAQ